MSFLERLVPAPLTSVALLLLWLLLSRSTSAGQFVMGLVLGLAVPHLTSELRPSRVRVRHPLLIARFVLKVGWDVVC
ncbi:MAG TPA: Na+/H+ antiporter subunit E, partial [Polyangiaceae bacterium]|nr:Na+/H+ antiporter subunit E [Polyangiaceae bacterium]